MSVYDGAEERMSYFICIRGRDEVNFHIVTKRYLYFFSYLLASKEADRVHMQRYWPLRFRSNTHDLLYYVCRPTATVQTGQLRKIAGNIEGAQLQIDHLLSLQ